MSYSSVSGGAPTTGFIFPMLSLPDIQAGMSDIGLELSMEELQDPAHHKEKLRKVFLFLLNICAGKNESDFIPTSEMVAKINSLPHPELHQDFSELQFYTYLREMLECAGYANFSWRDLHSPTPKRLQYQLSAIFNLAKYREDQLMFYKELNEPRNKILEAYDNVNKENLELTEQKQHVVLQSKENFVLMQEIMNECEGLEMEIARNNQVQAAAREEAAALKKKANDLKDEVVTAVWYLQELEAEEEKLRLQVVSSPDRRKSEMLVRKERLRKAKAECTGLEEAIQDCKTKVVNGKQTLHDLETTNTALSELHGDAKKHTELIRKIEDTRKKVALRQKYLTVKNDEIEEENLQLERAEKAIVSQRKQHTLYMEAAQEALDQAKVRLLNVERERRHGVARVESGMASVRELQATLDREQESAEEEVQLVMEQYRAVEAKFLDIDHSYMEAFQRDKESTSSV